MARGLIIAAVAIILYGRLPKPSIIMKILTAFMGFLLGLSLILIISDSVVSAKKKKKEVLNIDHKAYYIVPSSFSSKRGSPCSQYRYHNGSFRCFVMNINEFIDFHDDTDDSYNTKYNRLLVFLSGVHYVNFTQRQQLSDKPSFRVNIIGVGNVTIACMTEFHFLFDDIQHLTVENVHFKNCSNSDSKTTFTLNIMRIFGNDIFVSFEDVQISGTNITGIKLNIKGAVKWAQARIRIFDSVISTGAIGVYVVSQQHLPNKNSVAFIMNVARTSFHTSCFALQSRYSNTWCGNCKNNVIEIDNTYFLGPSTCSSVVAFEGDMKVTLNNVLFMATKSQYLIHSVISSLTMKGLCNIYHNKGIIFIEAHIGRTRDPYYSELVFTGATVKFVNNTIMGKESLDAVMAIKDSHLIFTNSNVSFINNYGANCGGIAATNADISLHDSVIISFIGNKGEVSGALLFYSSSMSSDHSTLSKLLLYKNKGPAIVSSTSELFFADTELIIINNTAYGSDVFVIMSTIVIANSSSANFNNSTIRLVNNQGQQCGGIVATKNSMVSFVNNSKALFFGNLGELGGAISLSSMSVLQFDHGRSNVTLTFYKNQARKGGAIFVDDSTYIYAHKLQISAIQKVGALTRLSFSDNVALIGGSNIYGGWIDWSASNGDIVFTTDIWNSLEIRNKDINPEITSDSLRICICNNQVPNCSITSLTFKQLYPGNTVDIDIVAIGQREGTMLSPVIATLEENDDQIHSGKIRDSQAVQIVQKTCTHLSYTIMSPNEQERLILTPFRSSEFGLKSQAKEYETIRYFFGSQLLDIYPYKLGRLFKQFTINLELKRCPLSFSLDEIQHGCKCPSSLSLLQLSCNTVKYQIIRSEQQWVGITYNHTGNHSGVIGLIAHQHCPFGYCKSTTESLSMNLEHQDAQCAYHRAGILCGGCQTNYSRVVGSLKCKECSSYMLFAIIPSFIAAGLALIALLLVLNLTVSTGTINGLIFYVNIIHTQHSVFFHSGISNSFLTTFIAWLNLDLGIESCLYPGFNSYAEIWLQFCFPFYTWILVAVIIILCHFSSNVSRLCGKNIVEVLATVFMLSYMKLLHLVIDIVSFASITYPDGYTKYLWLYDGNFDFLKGKHIPLFIAALLLITLFIIPYTFCQLLFQWISHFRIMFWIQPLFSSYTSPYKEQHRYWTGLLLFVRIVLLIIVSINVSNNPSINLFCIALISFMLLAWLYFARWVYGSFLNNFLELTFLLNLGLTAIVCLFHLSSNKHTMYSTTVMYTSTGIAYVMFVAVILYHAQRQLFQTKRGANIKAKLILFLRLKNDGALKDNIHLQPCEVNSPKKITYTVVELTEPLLED